MALSRLTGLALRRYSTTLQSAPKSPLVPSTRKFEAVDPAVYKLRSKTWKELIYFFVPGLCLVIYNVLYINVEDVSRPEFVKWDHMRCRTKDFPWGEGNRNLFYNKERNALPDGYEFESDPHH